MSDITLKSFVLSNFIDAYVSLQFPHTVWHIVYTMGPEKFGCNDKCGILITDALSVCREIAFWFMPLDRSQRSVMATSQHNPMWSKIYVRPLNITKPRLFDSLWNSDNCCDMVEESKELNINHWQKVEDNWSHSYMISVGHQMEFEEIILNITGCRDLGLSH